MSSYQRRAFNSGTVKAACGTAVEVGAVEDMSISLLPKSTTTASAMGGGFNSSTQHTKRPCGGRSVADEEKAAHLLLSQATGAYLGALGKGETLHQIARLFDRYHSSIQRIVAETGGIRPTERRRSRSALTLSEREEISRGVVAGKSMRAIAATLGRAPSTISREIRRNEGAQGYRASQATRERGIEVVAHRSVNFCRIERWPTSGT